MSWTHIFTTHEFWLGVPSGAVLAVTPALIAARSLRNSDRRKFVQEEKVLDRKETREDRLREQEILREAAMEFTQVSTDILTTTIDIKGIFNSMRDWFHNRTGQDDPMADAKFDHSEKVMDAQMRITMPVNRLKMVAPPHVLAAAIRATAAIMTTVQQTTEPFAGRVAHKAASDELNNFISVFRQEIGQDPYTNEEQQQQVFSFMETLKQQVAAYVEEAKADMKAAGFKTTPWDKQGNRSSSDPDSSTPEPTFVGPVRPVLVRSLKIGDDISLPIAQSGTRSIGLRSTVRGFNEQRTEMTLLVHKTGETITVKVRPDQQFDIVAPPRAS